MARGSRPFDLGRASHRLAGARSNACAHGLSATCLYSVCSRRAGSPLALVAEGAFRGLSVLRVPDLPGLSGVLYRIPPGAGARTPLLPGSLTALAFRGRMAGGRDADHSR